MLPDAGLHAFCHRHAGAQSVDQSDLTGGALLVAELALGLHSPELLTLTRH